MRQIAFINSLLRKLCKPELTLTRIEESQLSIAEASEMIDQLKNTPLPETSVMTSEKLVPGSYRRADGTVYRVYMNREGTRLLCAEWDEFEVEFSYVGLASRFVKAADLMSLADSQAFGREFGVCCQCGRLLTNPDSIAAGIGPICAGRF
jgi:Family of unknown function (DUF6011)